VNRPLPLLLLLALTLAPAALAQDADGDSHFPLSVGQTWTYQLDLTRGAEKQSLVYTSRVTETETLDGVTCFVVEQKSDERLFQRTWYSVDADGTVRNPRRQNGGRVHVLRSGESDEGRVLFEPDALETIGTAWAWRTADGSAEGTIEVEKHETLRLPKPLRAELECVVLLERGTFLAGGRTATQERRMWLASGLGLVKETSVIRIGDEIATSSEAYLIQFPRQS
jgi:hypothetical protein